MKLKAQRYKLENRIYTQHDVFQELINYISIFKFKDYTIEILKKRYNVTNEKKYRRLSELIKLHISLAIDLIDQSINSKPDLSYLPSYYACLNLIKCHLIFLDKSKELLLNKRHGIKYNDSPRARKLLNENLVLYQKGTIPLYCQLMTNKQIPKKGISYSLKSIYSNILTISAEYKLVTNKEIEKVILKTNTQKTAQGIRFYFSKKNDELINLPSVSQMPALSNFKLGANKQNYLLGKLFTSHSTAQEYIDSSLNNYFFQNYYCLNCKEFHLVTNRSDHKYPVNEDVSIALAYFHLSNVVRYNPEHFYRILDSKNYPMLMSLQRNGLFTILKSMASHYFKETFEMLIAN